MTVASTTAKAGPYSGNDVTVDFDWAFKTQAAADIRVVSTVTTDGVQIDTDQVITTDYTVSMNADQDASPGGTVTMVAAPATGETITILRDVSATQGASLPNQGGWYPKVVENALDKQAMLVQQINEELTRCLKLSVADSITDLQDLLTTINTSTSAASASASAASASETAAGNSETAAAASEVAAGLSETAAGLSETAAGLSETAAGNSASSASSSASTATTQAGIATTKAGLTAADAIATAADRVQTGLDAIATAADAIATAADRVQTGLDASAASGSASAASASAASAAAIANAFIGTSTTAWTPAVESKAFTTQAGELYTAGIYVTVVSAAAPTAYGWGQVTSYTGTTLTVDVQLAAGSGSHTDWNISLAGVRGATGATGATGAGITADAVGFHMTGGTTPKTLTVTEDVTLAAQPAILGANTFTGDQTLAENAGLVLDAALSADGKYSGIVEAGTSAAALAFGEVCYRVTATGKWNLARAAAADVGTVVATGELGMCVLAAAGADAATTMLKFGKVRADALFDTFTVGAPVYLSAATAGKTVSAAPTGTTDFTVRKLGFAEDANTVFFNPSNDYVTLA